VTQNCSLVHAACKQGSLAVRKMSPLSDSTRTRTVLQLFLVPNWEEKDEMEISFQPPHTSLSSKSEDNFQAHQLSDLGKS